MEESQIKENKISQNETTNEVKKFGPAIGILLIILIIGFGGMYIWGRAIDNSLSGDEIQAQPDTVTEQLSKQGASDDIQAIEQDVNATDLNNIDADLNNIDAELGI